MRSSSLPCLAIDARMAGSIEHGIAKYVSLLAQGLAQKNRSQPLRYRPVFLVNEGKEFFSFETLKVNSPFLKLSELIEIPKVLAKSGAAAYHSPSFASLWSCPCPHLITIHDLIHLKFGNFAQKLYYQILLKRFALRASATITVSNSSRTELAAWSGIPSSKIRVVLNALEAESELGNPTSLLDSLRLEKGKYFLCLGSLKRHKNVPLLLSAYREFRKQCIAKGQTAWPLVLTLPESASSDGILAVGKLPSRNAEILLRCSAGLFSPSLCEGFGLPPVEAATAGIRLAISDIPSHREGLAELSEREALWVKPQDFQGWVQAFQAIHEQRVAPPSPSSQKKIRNQLSIQRIGEDMDQIYTSVLGITST
jgi:glycosyltransferase involved in cell wall biosynthesis